MLFGCMLGIKIYECIVLVFLEDLPLLVLLGQKVDFREPHRFEVRCGNLPGIEYFATRTM